MILEQNPIRGRGNISQRQQIDRLKQEQLNDLCTSGLITIVILLFSSFNGPECVEAPFKMWTQIEGGYYFINLLFSWIYYKNLCRNNREST